MSKFMGVAHTGQKATVDKTGQVRFANSTEVAAGTATDVVASIANVSEISARTELAGQATLVLGTVTVADTSILATDKIFLQRQGVASSTALGVLDVDITAATSFTITSLDATTPANTETGDLSVIDYFIVHTV